jgi:hypothetical protein
MTPARILQLERLGLLRARPRRSRARHSSSNEAPQPPLEPASPPPPPLKAGQLLALLPPVKKSAADVWGVGSSPFGSSRLDRVRKR